MKKEFAGNRAHLPSRAAPRPTPSEAPFYIFHCAFSISPEVTNAWRVPGERDRRAAGGAGGIAGGGAREGGGDRSPVARAAGRDRLRAPRGARHVRQRRPLRAIPLRGGEPAAGGAGDPVPLHPLRRAARPAALV